MHINFSIIIPTWNRKERLSELINRVIEINKNYLNYEIIVCDSNSTDGTEKTIESIIKKNPNANIKLKHAIYNNVSQKRNIGILNAKFDHIILIDDDCLPEKDFFNNYSQLVSANIGKKFILNFENEVEKYCYMWKETGEYAKKNSNSKS